MIRYANKEDLNKEFFDLYYEGFLYHYEHRKDIFKKRSIDELKEYLFNQIDNDDLKILFLEEDNNFIGFLTYEVKKKLTTSLWIDELIIKEEYRSHGYGTILIDKIKEICKNENIDRIELNCWSFNEKAMKFYNKLNFDVQRTIFELII